MPQRKLKGLKPGRTYVFKVRARSGNAFGPWSPPIISTTALPGGPGAVTLSASAGISVVDLSWDEGTGEVWKYEVHVSTSPGFTPSGSTRWTRTVGQAASYPGTPGTTYYFKVVPVNPEKVPGTASNEVSAVPTAPNAGGETSDGSPPGSSPTPTVVGGVGFLLIKWEEISNPDAVTYEVHLATASGGPYTKIGETAATNFFVRTDAAGGALSYGTTYHAKIKAKDVDGSAALGTSASGSMVKATTADIAVAAITAASGIVLDLTADVITAGHITSSSIYLGSGTTFHLDGTNKVIEIKDTQGSPVTRLKIGKLGAASTDYGIEIYDSSGVLRWHKSFGSQKSELQSGAAITADRGTQRVKMGDNTYPFLFCAAADETNYRFRVDTSGNLEAVGTIRNDKSTVKPRVEMLNEDGNRGVFSGYSQRTERSGQITFGETASGGAMTSGNINLFAPKRTSWSHEPYSRVYIGPSDGIVEQYGSASATGYPYAQSYVWGTSSFAASYMVAENASGGNKSRIEAYVDGSEETIRIDASELELRAGYTAKGKCGFRAASPAVTAADQEWEVGVSWSGFSKTQNAPSSVTFTQGATPVNVKSGWPTAGNITNRGFIFVLRSNAAGAMEWRGTYETAVI